jgi:hypothetical protein
LPKDVYWVERLVGRGDGSKLGDLGRVADVIRAGGDLLLSRMTRGETLIPMVSSS